MFNYLKFYVNTGVVSNMLSHSKPPTDLYTCASIPPIHQSCHGWIQACVVFCNIMSSITLFWDDFFSNVKPILDALCSGRQSCTTEMRDFWDLTEKWSLTSSCPKELANYLQARFTCIPGELFAVARLNTFIKLTISIYHITYLTVDNMSVLTFLFQLLHLGHIAVNFQVQLLIFVLEVEH